jgi:site-specific DNA-methyltransferase (adenine-specific)
LGQLVSIRRHLDLRQPADRFLLATLCGILHANARADGTPRGLTVAMPNTFAMAPAYVARYIKAHDLKPPHLDVLDALSERLRALELPDNRFHKGSAWMQDASQRGAWPREASKASLVLTSPPYLAVMKYGKLNWIRSWLIGADPKEVDRGLFSTASLPKYLDFMARVLKQCRSRMRDGGYMCLVVGDVRKGDWHLNLARKVVESCVSQTDLRHVQTISDGLPVQHKVSRIWGMTRGRATKTDRIIILAGPKARELPELPKVDWQEDDCYGE